MPPFTGWYVELFIFRDREKIEKKLSSLELPPLGRAVGVVYEKEDHAPLMVLPHDVKARVVVHECFHAMQGIFRQIGEDEPGEETAAYLLDYLFSEVSKKVQNYD